MYPTLYHAFLDLFGLDLPLLKFLNSFGFFVALAFVAASWTLTLELKRKGGSGLIQSTTRRVWVGRPASPLELITNGLIGSTLGWKVFGMITDPAASTMEPPKYLLSGHGSFLGGVVLGALFAWMRWREAEKQRLPEPREEDQVMHPYMHAGNITMVAALWGFIGAKVFNFLESPSELINFIRHPSGDDIFSGLTMYGGLIVAGIMVIRYFVKHKLAVLPSMDAAAPGLMLAYSIGRIGCQISGDGDWGIVNTHPAPSWIPRWLWSYDYPNNVHHAGVGITEGPCFDGYCTHLVPGVWPTPLYEVIMCAVLAGVLWSLRKRISIPGGLFAVYLIMNGFERFWIEKIRVNEKLIGNWTQAEVISTLLFLTGLGMWWWVKKRHADGPQEAH